MEEIYKRPTKVEYISNKENRFADYVVRFEEKGEDLEEKQGPSKLTRHAGIEDYYDDAQDYDDDDDHGDYPSSTAFTVKALIPPEKTQQKGNPKVNYSQKTRRALTLGYIRLY